VRPSSTASRSRRRRGRWRSDGLEFLTANARALPFDEGDFDLVVFDSTLWHVPDAERAVEESFRVLRPAACSPRSTATTRP
jgi:ubiquinone/menaquinone biosynthesis C-methylase UbiE